MMSTSSSRPKWHYPPPPTPRFLHFPRRRRTLTTTNPPSHRADTNLISPIVVLHHHERRRERVESSEMLRAECNLLRMEKEIAVNKLEKTRAIINTTLTSTLHTLLSLSLIHRSNAFDDNIVASGKLNVEILRRRMEGLSKGVLLQRMEEEYNSLLSTATSSLSGSASSSKRTEFQDASSSIPVPPHQEKVPREGNLCSGHCKTIVRRIVEQVRVETEQLSEMQEMLVQVRLEMEDSQSSQDFWENRAMQSEFQTQPLHNALQEWRQRAVTSESKTNELEEKISILNGELESLRKEKNAVHGTKCSPIPPLDTQNALEKRIVVCTSKENSKKHNEVLRNGERKAHAAARGRVQATKRSPFQDIGNNSSLSMRQNGKVVLPLHYHISSNVEKTR